jgi:toxin YoeB
VEKVWSDKAWNDYLFWQHSSKKDLKKINTLIMECSRTPFEGTGKPEPLKFDKQGYWSRRISHKDRLVYKMLDGRLYTASCRDHYGEK